MDGLEAVEHRVRDLAEFDKKTAEQVEQLRRTRADLTVLERDTPLEALGRSSERLLRQLNEERRSELKAAERIEDLALLLLMETQHVEQLKRNREAALREAEDRLEELSRQSPPEEKLEARTRLELAKADNERLLKIQDYLGQAQGSIKEIQSRSEDLPLVRRSLADWGRNSTRGPRGPNPSAFLALQTVFFATNREIKGASPVRPASFTGGRSPNMQYGVTVVSVPKNHRIGNVERPGLNILQSAVQFSLVYNEERDADHFRIKLFARLSRSDLVGKLSGDSESVLLFIHGYNVSFEDAIFKAAQIAYDANFGGHVLVFSWPSAGALFGYDYDRESAAFSTEDLLQIFRMLSGEIGRKRVYVVAHSLGNEVLLQALQQAALSKVKLRNLRVDIGRP